MDPVALLAIATLAFLATHFVTRMIWAYAAAPREQLWVGTRELAYVAMPLAFILIKDVAEIVNKALA